MEDVAMRRVIQHLAQGASVSEQIELCTLRDLQQKLTERFACAVRKGEKLEKFVRLVLLPPRNKRRAFASVTGKASRATSRLPPPRRSASMPYPLSNEP